MPVRRIGEADNPGPKAKKAVTVTSYNGNCWKTIRDWLRFAKAAVVLIQEHRCCSGEQYDKMSAQAKMDGWKLYGTPANPTDLEKASGGTAVLAPHWLAAKQVGAHLVDGFTVAKGRASAVMVDVLLKNMLLKSITIIIQFG